MIKIFFYILSISTLVLMSCTSQKNQDSQSSKNLVKYVNPMIGTSKMGHVYPGATAPFGMVQLSPQTDEQPLSVNGRYNRRAYEYCAGYQYKDSTIIGFSHTNFSGTGHSDLGDFLVMPTTGKLVLNPKVTKDGEKGFYSTFSHKNEDAQAGYYKVDLDTYGIKAELTATERVGFHQYTFPKSTESHILLDLMYNVYNHKNKNVWTFIRVENDSLVTGYRQTKGWARTKKVFFAMAFSKPFKSYGHKKYDKLTYNGFYGKFDEYHNFPEMAGKNIRAYFNFDTQENEKIKIKFALSPVSTAGALKNLKAEVPGWNFDAVKKETQQKWNQELSKIDVETVDPSQKETFYTALYHTMLSPILYEDVDGKYRGLDQNIHESKGFTNYTIFSLWDTYRALHPLFNVIQQKRNNDMIKSMLAHQSQSVHHMLPIWSHYANENWCMIGYHAVSVIADAIVKNVGDFDKKQALKAAVETANVPYFDGLGDYIKYHYVPSDKSSSSVSKTLEYSYDDWCIAQIAKSTNNTEVEKTFLERATYYKNVFNPVNGYMSPKLSDGTFRKNFDPLDTQGQGFIEGNAWNYGLYVPQNIDKMVAMMGGKERFSQHLDSLFTMEIADKYIDKHEDITRDGIIGNYVQGNEPGHHIPYLYNWTGKEYKTQARVRMIMDTMYGPGVEGLCGNDDAGQMSAWFVFSSLGFYPVVPGSDHYALGSPFVKKAVLHLENGHTLTINTINQGKENVYVKSLKINGQKIDRNYILHSELMNGGKFVFEMSATPTK